MFNKKRHIFIQTGQKAFKVNDLACYFDRLKGLKNAEARTRVRAYQDLLIANSEFTET